MKAFLNLEFDNERELIEWVTRTIPTEPAMAMTMKQRKPRKPKAEAVAPAKPEAPAEPEAPAAEPEAPSEPELDLRDTVRAFSKVNGTKDLLARLKKRGYEKVTAISGDEVQSFLRELVAAS